MIVSDKHRKVKEEAEQTFEKFSNRIDSSQDRNKIPQSVHFMIIIQTFEIISRPKGRIVGLLKSRDFDQQIQAVDCLLTSAANQGYVIRSSVRTKWNWKV